MKLRELGVRCFRRDGSPIEDFFEWAQLMESDLHRVVAQTRAGNVIVSTVWLGIAHGTRDGRPLIFESAVFGDEIGPLDQVRYATEDDAREGHRQLVAKWSAPKASERGE